MVIAQSSRTPAQVISIGDGDTLRVQLNNQPVTVRLSCIDAPENNQSGGDVAAQRLAQLLPGSTAITLRIVETDRYGRTVAEVYQNDVSINLQMVQEGQAVVYDKYLDGCAETRDRYLAAEAQAQERQLAFWRQTNPIMPWEWRNGMRPASPSPSPSSSPVAACDPSYPTICIPANSPDLDCGDITDRRFTVQGSDPHRFDRDRDGIGCES